MVATGCENCKQLRSLVLDLESGVTGIAQALDYNEPETARQIVNLMYKAIAMFSGHTCSRGPTDVLFPTDMAYSECPACKVNAEVKGASRRG